MVNTQLLGLGNSVWALIFPMSFNAFLHRGAQDVLQEYTG